MDELVESRHKLAAAHKLSTLPNRPIDLNIDKDTSDYIPTTDKQQVKTNLYSTEEENNTNLVMVASSNTTLTQEKDVQITI